MNSQRKKNKFSPKINVILKNMPHDITGNTVQNEDGSYTVTINARHSYERQKRAYKHELIHIEHDYNQDYVDVNAAEYRARLKSIKLRRNSRAIRDVFRQLKKAKEHQARQWLSQYIAEAKKKESQSILPAYTLDGYYTITEADYYPDGAYEELKRMGWV